VHIAPPFITAPGVYQLVFQSFDDNGSVKSTLKEDKIVITVLETEYLRDTAVPKTIEVTAGDTSTLSVQNIYSVYDIGKTLYIQLRQKSGAELDMVTIIQGSPALLRISLSKLAGGSLTLIVQSYDDNSSLKPTLKEDTITINVIASDQATSHISSAIDASVKLGLA